MSFSTILLQAPTPPALGGGSTAEYLFRAAQQLIGVGVEKCLVFIPLMLFLHLIIALVKTYFGDMTFDPSSMIRIIFVWIALAAYEPLAYAIYNATMYFTGVFGSTQDVLKSLRDLSDNPYLAAHKQEFGLPGKSVTIPFNDATSFFTWLVLAVENGLAMIIRVFIERIRAILIAFILAAGPFAFAFSTIPGLGGVVGQWFRAFVSTSLWGLTLAILDAIMIGFAKTWTVTTGTPLAEAGAVLDLLVINAAIIIMYLSVPLLTSIYFGGSAAASFLKAAQGAVGGVAGAAGGYAAGRYSHYTKDQKGKMRERNGQEMAKRNKRLQENGQH